MGRKAKVNVPEEELKALDNNEVTPKDLGEKYEQPRSYFDNIKHRRKLQTSFSLKTADASMSNDQMKQQTPELAQDQTAQGTLGAPQINYHTAVKGLYKGADSIFKLVAVMSKGQLEYTSVSDQQLEDLATVTENDAMIQKVATMGGVSTIVTVGSILGTFGGQFKVKKKIKHDAKNPLCKCDRCEKLRSVFDKDNAEPLPEDLKNEEITEITNVKPVIPEVEEKANNEKMASEIKEAFADKKTNSAGMIIEKNHKPNISESEVLKRNGSENF